MLAEIYQLQDIKNSFCFKCLLQKTSSVTRCAQFWKISNSVWAKKNDTCVIGRHCDNNLTHIYVFTIHITIYLPWLWLCGMFRSQLMSPYEIITNNSWLAVSFWTMEITRAMVFAIIWYKYYLFRNFSILSQLCPFCQYK